MITSMPESIGEKAAGALRAFSEVRLAYLFGSQARGDARSTSDVDVAVLADGPLSLDACGRLIDALAAALGRRIDLVDLATAPPLLLQRLIAGGRVLVCRDENTRVRFETRAIARFLDTRHLRTVQHSYLRGRRRQWLNRSKPKPGTQG
jgi:hypothetical protein